MATIFHLLPRFIKPNPHPSSPGRFVPGGGVRCCSALGVGWGGLGEFLLEAVPLTHTCCSARRRTPCESAGQQYRPLIGFLFFEKCWLTVLAFDWQ